MILGEIILIILVVAFLLLLLIGTVYGETEKGCVAYKTNHLMIIGQYKGDLGGCDWLVDKLLYNSSGWHVSGYASQPQTYIDGYTIHEFEKFVMTK